MLNFFMNLIQHLKPIEALYLLDHAGIETMTIENSLAANLGYLAHNSFIKFEEKLDSNMHLSIDTNGEQVLNNTIDKKAMKFIRQYELDSIKTIMNKNEDYLLYILNDFDFKKHLANEGFFKLKNTPLFSENSFLRFIKLKEYSTTEKYFSAINELKNLRLELKSDLTKPSVNKNSNPMLYTFPSLLVDNTYLRLAQNICNDDFSDFPNYTGSLKYSIL